MTDWLIILTTVGVLWALWWFMGTVADLFAYWYAARRGEAMSANKERERS